MNERALLFCILWACAAKVKVAVPLDTTPPVFRLPTLAEPTHVDLDLTLDPNAAQFHGVVIIDLEIRESTPILWLNATDLLISNAEISLRGETQAARVLTATSDFVGFVFARPLPAGKARLRITYQGRIDHDKALAIYSTTEASGESYLYTMFEPLDARRAFPCFDEPSAKVPWKLTLHVKKADIARANSAIESETDEANGMKAVTFTESKPLPSYLVAFVVGPFDIIKGQDAGHFHTPLDFIVPKGRGAETRYAAEVTPKIVGYLEDYFGMPYPYGKLDVAVVPRYWGTMEHPGLVAMGQPLTLIPPNAETISRKQSYADIVAHELAHYWFGDYVTLRWWDDTWLNESMAQWMDAKITDRADPSWKYDRVRLDRAEAALQDDALTSAKRIREPVLSPDDIANAFDASLTYDKGQAVLGMFEQWMVPPVFQRAVRQYLTAHAWGNANEEDLLSALGPEVGDAMRTFVDQPGAPFIEAKPICDEHVGIALSQRRYAPAGVELSPELWKVPVCVRYGDAKGTNEHACMLLSTANARLPLETETCPTWVMANAGASGYYRSKYDKAALAAVLNAKKSLDPAELTTLMHDAAALVDSGDLSLGDALSLLPNVADANDRYVLTSAFTILRIARSIANDAERTRYANYLRGTFGKHARLLGWKPKPGESKDDELLRPLLLYVVAVSGLDLAMQKEARALAQRWLSDPMALDGELVEAALAAAAKTNDPALFDAILAAAEKTGDRADKARLFSALGAFTDAALSKSADAVLADTTLDLHDTEGILHTQLRDAATRDAAYAFFDANFDSLRARLRDDEAMWLFDIPRAFCDQAQVQAMTAALTPRAKKIPGAARTLDGALEVAKLCAAKADAQRASLDAFLQRY